MHGAPPPEHGEDILDSERGSVRRLDTVGAVAVLGAMIEQKQQRASQPSVLELATEDDDPWKSPTGDDADAESAAKREDVLKAR